MIQNRELSWLKFNARVLSLCTDLNHPLCERLNFLSIAASNLDEFFMVRVAAVSDQILAGYQEKDRSGFTPEQALLAILSAAREQIGRQYAVYREALVPEMEKRGIVWIQPDELTQEQHGFLRRYFLGEVFPVLTPMAIDVSRPFPLVSNKSLNLALYLRDQRGAEAFATVQVPDVLPRAVALPDSGGFFYLEDLIRLFAPMLFSGCEILSCHAYRIIRNADLAFDEDEASDLLMLVEKKLRQRKWGAVIRVELEANMHPKVSGFLKEAFDVADERIFQLAGPLNLSFVRQMSRYIPDKAERYPPFTPRSSVARGEDLFEAVARGDIFLHHPFDSFDTVVSFVTQAAEDQNVLAIKQTLYRVSEKSPVVSALMRAAESGKQVTALFEVKARFDEENNIHWGRRLEQAGCHVIYGLPGLKTHAKITLVIRREARGIRQYLHLGTGNYNDVTARLYTDMGILTCDSNLGMDATLFFNMLSGYTAAPAFSDLSAAPDTLCARLLELIDGQAKRAKAGERARIIAKMNALVDEEIIRALYRASQAGVEIRLIVRGICCLRAGVPGLSENIEVISIVGRFLEHSRIFCFLSDAQSEVYLSSADWMPRNLHTRVELMFPVKEPAIRLRILSILEIYLSDTSGAWRMQPDGNYRKIAPEGRQKDVDAQKALLKSKRI